MRGEEGGRREFSRCKEGDAIAAGRGKDLSTVLGGRERDEEVHPSVVLLPVVQHHAPHLPSHTHHPFRPRSHARRTHDTPPTSPHKHHIHPAHRGKPFERQPPGMGTRTVVLGSRRQDMQCRSFGRVRAVACARKASSHVQGKARGGGGGLTRLSDLRVGNWNMASACQGVHTASEALTCAPCFAFRGCPLWFRVLWIRLRVQG